MTAKQALDTLPASIGERYRVEAPLGVGGMGTVYRVLDTTTGERLALKQLKQALVAQRPEIAEMFSREYRTLSQLTHPSVIAVHDYGVADTGPYYTMELLQGSDLHASAPVPWRQVCAQMRDVCSSLSLLHSRRLIHRDVSPRNVLCDGERAKLIDFGAMIPMGPAMHVVGTPPFVPPEVLNGQSLDGRCDLFALGATAYWALAGKHAYPARTLDALPHVWERRPAALPAATPDALSTLVFSLLSLDADARPRTAAEVMERLSAIAGLQTDELLHVPQAYLTAPSLTGRKAELEAFRRLLSTARAGASTAVLLTGAPGAGRTRMLDVAAVEARLAGFEVLRPQISDALRADCGIADALLSRADQVFGDLAETGLPVDTIRVTHAPSPQLGDLNRSRRISRVRATVRRITARTPLMVAVDDVDALDAPSQALLSTLVQSARRGLVLLLSARSAAALDPMLEALFQRSPRHELRPLDPQQSAVLLGHVFGEVPGLATIASAVHALADGNPRATMELAQHLVDTGKARYGLGGWTLPRRLERGDLPSGFHDLLHQRLQALGDDAQELSVVLACAARYRLPDVAIDALTSHRDPARRHHAEDALIAVGLLQNAGGQQFTSTALPQQLLDGADPTLRARAYGHLAAYLSTAGHDPIEVARCHFLAGDEASGLQALLAAFSTESRFLTGPADYADLLQQGLRACAQGKRPERERLALLLELVRVGEHLGVAGIPERYAEIFETLCATGGPDDWHALPDALDPGERLQQAFAALQARHDGLPTEQRVMPPFEALRTLALACRQAATFGAISMNAALIDGLPDLSPFAGLSPALQAAADYTLPACRHLTAARYEQARACYIEVLQRLSEPDHAGLDDDYWQWSIGALHFALGHIHAGLGIDRALEHAAELEHRPEWEVAAWDVRHAYHQRFGNWKQAETCRTRMESLILESGRRPQMVDTSARLALDAAAHAGDLMLARRAMERIAPLIELHPGYAPYEHFGPAVCELLQGNHDRALAHGQRAAAMVTAGQHPTWPWIVECELMAMFHLGQLEQTRALALRYLADAEAAQLRIMAHHVIVPLALAEAKLGDTDAALRRLDAVIAEREALGMGGVNLGWAYEQRARVAIWAGDAVAFMASAAQCARQYGRGRGGSSLMGKYEALRSEAHAAVLTTPSMVPTPADPGSHTTVATTQYADSMLGAEDFEERCVRALSLLLSESGAVGGALYRWDGSRLQRVGVAPAHFELPADADALAGSCIADDETDGADITTATAVGRAGTRTSDRLAAEADTEQAGTRTSDRLAAEADTEQPAGSRLLPVGLSYYRAGSYRRSGVALLGFDRAPGPLSLELIEFVARMLQETSHTIIR